MAMQAGHSSTLQLGFWVLSAFHLLHLLQEAEPAVTASGGLLTADQTVKETACHKLIAELQSVRSKCSDNE